MLDFSDRMRTGISILTTAADIPSSTILDIFGECIFFVPREMRFFCSLESLWTIEESTKEVAKKATDNKLDNKKYKK